MKNVFLIGLLLVLISIGGALECHQCSKENVNCNDPLNVTADGVRVITCDTTKKHVCYKASGTITVGGIMPVSGTQRDCILDTLVQPCMLIKLGLENQKVRDITCYTCSEDRCNENATGTASGLTSLKMILLLPFLVSFLWRKI